MQRILSDLHLFDGASRVRQLNQLGPLLDGVDDLLINGDSCDTQVCATPEQVAEMRAYFETRVPRVTFVTGNHDPDISSLHETWLGHQRVWATHGDVFFPDATPWSKLLPEIRRRISTSQHDPACAHSDPIAARLRVFRAICHGLPIPVDLRSRSWRVRLQRLLVDLGSPSRIMAVLQAWREGPMLGAALAAQHRSSAQVVVFGHIHRPSVSLHGDRHVINTGAFAGPLGGLVVDVTEDHVFVRSLERTRGHFRAKSAVTAIPLADPR